MSVSNKKKGHREGMKIIQYALHLRERVQERDLKGLRAQVINNISCQGSVSLHL